MTSTPTGFAAIRHPLVRDFLMARVLAIVGAQIVNVAVGWQLYERTGSALSLGFVGLFELAPALLFMVPAGNVADRFPRRTIAASAVFLTSLASLLLMVVSSFQAPVTLVYLILLVIGAARAFSAPAISTTLPQIIPRDLFVNANAWSSSAFQLSAIAGPALGGFIIAWTGSATWAYLAAAVTQLGFVVLFLRLPKVEPAASDTKRTFSDVFAGFAFVRRTEVFLAAITLDMFAVLLGGAVALLPIFAKDILHVGADGLGWLRAAPSIGSLLLMLIMMRIKPFARPGIVLLVAVTGFGLATIAFGMSTNFLLSFACLFVTGACDAVSVVIRLTTEQMVTPDHLRGRVSAINFVFIGFSNEFGTFESGTTAGLFGPVASVVGGGIGTIVVVGIVALMFPKLAQMGPLHTLKPETIEAAEEQQASAEIRRST